MSCPLHSRGLLPPTQGSPLECLPDELYPTSRWKCTQGGELEWLCRKTKRRRQKRKADKTRPRGSYSTTPPPHTPFSSYSTTPPHTHPLQQLDLPVVKQLLKVQAVRQPQVVRVWHGCVSRTDVSHLARLNRVYIAIHIEYIRQRGYRR